MELVTFVLACYGITNIVCFGKALYIRELFTEFLKIWQNRFDLGLLKHYLGDPYLIRILCISPRQVTVIFIIPFKQ